MSSSVKEIRAREADLIKSGAVTSWELMAKAAEGLYNVFLNHRSERRNAAIIAGKGNNGGDGYALACLFAERAVPHAIAAIEEPSSDEAVFYREKYEGLRHKNDLAPIFDAFSSEFNEYIADNAVVIDCMLGTGISGVPRYPYDEAIKQINASGAFVIACDIPSGLGDCGIADIAVKADVTAAIGAEKDAYYLNDGKDYSGIIEGVDIGLSIADSHILVNADAVRELFPARRNNSHKGTYGTAVLIGCSEEYVGAGELAAMAAINTAGLSALRSGAGLTRLVVPDRMLAQMWSRVRDCSLGLKSKLKEYGASAYGYGMGVGMSDYATLEYLVRDTGETPLLIDADGINMLARNIELLKHKPDGKPIILTPHVKEMSRLSGKIVDEILKDPIEAAEAFAAEHGITLLLKGTGSVVTDGKRTYINAHGSNCLAKGGSGDVLSGIITALLARGADALGAGAAACYILGEASLIAERQYGAYSTTPTDVAKAIKKITRQP